MIEALLAASSLLVQARSVVHMSKSKQFRPRRRIIFGNQTSTQDIVSGEASPELRNFWKGVHSAALPKSLYRCLVSALVHRLILVVGFLSLSFLLVG